jgi:ComF family protein
VETARALAHHMARSGVSLLREADLLVPVPLYWRRRLARRYNQSALLAWSLGRIAGCAVLPDALRRVRQTGTLAGKSRPEREATVADAFAMRPGRAAQVAGRRIVLVDDVLTTGATAGACTRVLMAAGAARVDLLVGARVEYSAPDEALP